jgi:hypothetical protein
VSRAVINEEVGEKGLKSYYLLGERRRGVRRRRGRKRGRRRGRWGGRRGGRGEGEGE